MYLFFINSLSSACLATGFSKNTCTPLPFSGGDVHRLLWITAAKVRNSMLKNK